MRLDNFVPQPLSIESAEYTRQFGCNASLFNHYKIIHSPGEKSHPCMDWRHYNYITFNLNCAFNLARKICVKLLGWKEKYNRMQWWSEFIPPTTVLLNLLCLASSSLSFVWYLRQDLWLFCSLSQTRKCTLVTLDTIRSYLWMMGFRIRYFIIRHLGIVNI